MSREIYGGSTGTQLIKILDTAGGVLGSSASKPFYISSVVATGAEIITNDNLFTLRDNGDTTKQMVFQLSGITTGTTRTLTVPDASGTLAVLGLAQRWIAAQTMAASMLLLENPAATFSYTIVPAAITAARNLSLPLITGADTLAALGLAQTWTALQSFGTNLGGTLQTAAQPNVTSLGTLTSLTVAGFTDITAGGLRISGASTVPTGEPSGGANTTALLRLAAGSSGANADSGLIFYRATSELGFEGFNGSTATIGNVAMATGDYKFSAAGVYAFFVDISNGNRVVFNNSVVAGAAVVVGADSANNQIYISSSGAGSTTLYIGNASINVTSDMRHKTNIRGSERDAANLLGALRVRDFQWADPSDTAEVNRNSRGRWTGLIAQEVVDLVPWVVNAPDRTCPTCRAGQPCDQHESFWHIEYEHLVPLTILGWQDHERRLAALEART